MLWAMNNKFNIKDGIVVLRIISDCTPSNCLTGS